MHRERISINQSDIRYLILFVTGIFLLSSLQNSYEISNGQTASLVLGQNNFTTSAQDMCTGKGPTASYVCLPTFLTFDDSGNLWVTDSQYYRILEFIPPFSNGSHASLVIGQTNFTMKNTQNISAKYLHPGPLAFDRNGSLWIGDENRLLEFTKPFSNGQSASLVLGQPDFRSHGANYGGKLCPDSIPKIPMPVSPICPTPQSLYKPSAITFDNSGDLWVADFYNNRILEFKPPFTNWENASLVIGQNNFTSRTCSTDMSSICNPQGLAFDSVGNLWVADEGHARILEFKKPLENGEIASLSIGEPNGLYTKPLSTSFSFGGLHKGSLQIAFDHLGDLWVSDNAGNRLLEFVPPFANGMSSSLVIGQPDFLSYQPNNGNDTPSANSLNSPSGISFDSKDNLFVADMMNDRILEYTNFQAPEFQFSTQVLLISMISLFIIYKLKFRYP